MLRLLGSRSSQSLVKLTVDLCLIDVGIRATFFWFVIVMVTFHN